MHEVPMHTFGTIPLEVCLYISKYCFAPESGFSHAITLMLFPLFEQTKVLHPLDVSWENAPKVQLAGMFCRFEKQFVEFAGIVLFPGLGGLGIVVFAG